MSVRIRKPAGFTLIELLVVISIIALLLSILMPALGKVKEQAKVIVCKTNLRQVGMAIHLYANDYNGLVPPFFEWDSSTNSLGKRRTSLGTGITDTKGGLALLIPTEYSYYRDSPYCGGSNYLPNADVFYCPSDKKDFIQEREKEHVALFRPPNKRDARLSYMYFYFVSNSYNAAHTVIARDNANKAPGRSFILGEVGYWGDDPARALSYEGYQYHKVVMSVVRLDGSSNTINGPKLEDKLEITPSYRGFTNWWTRRIHIIDNM